ncbi:MAG TPA: sugar phosphate isomerase/epimerase family protein [Bryobacteraceae bacterium]|nr:sugar phosphate isomerase/epimerase family protein [Bryobacteraceae bacterium]
MTRRMACGSLAAAAGSLLAKTSRFQLAVCNETYDPMSFADGCRAMKKAGYDGVEIAPPTLSEDPAALPASRRAELRNIMRSEGLRYVGLHRLLTVPKGLHVTTPDAAVRERSWSYLVRLIDLCADLGPGGVMVVGGSKERSTVNGCTVAEAVGRIQEGLGRLAPHAAQRRVTILLEALAPRLSDVINTMDEVVRIVRQVNSPAVTGMFDVHNAAAEKIPHGDVIRKYSRYIGHVHFNEMDGKRPGLGDYDYKPVMQALKDLSYDRWISVEPFDFAGGGEKVGRDSIEFIRAREAELT